MEATDAKRRRDALALARKAGADGLMVTDPFNLRWLSGFSGGEGALFFGGRRRLLLTDSRYTTQAADEAPDFEVVKFMRRPDEVATAVARLGIKKLAFEAEGMTHRRYLELAKVMGAIKLVPLVTELKKLRAVKTEAEVRLIARAATIARDALRECLPRLKVGMREREFAGILEEAMRRRGSGPAPFETIVASGPRGALPHGAASERRMKKGELVTIDYGAIYRGYQSDQTVTVALGRPKPELMKIYAIVREAQARALKLIRPGAVGKDVDFAAREYIKEQGYGEYFGHGLGHGVGLETHEEPALNYRSETALKPGMVVTVEPGIYLPGVGGVRIEDMALVTAGGSRRLTASTMPLREIMV